MDNLESLIAKAHTVNKELKAAEEAVLTDIREKARLLGYELMKIAKPLYSDDDGNTWTGKGRKPEWLKAKLEAGAQLEDFAI